MRREREPRTASSSLAALAGRDAIPVWALAGCWFILYLWRALIAHASLRTNAYDLSLFDYALWNTLQGQIGHVPFIGHSIFTQHFMPILVLLAPIYGLWESPIFLIVLQTLAMGTAGLVLYVIARRFGLARFPALAMVLVFLVCRRSHGATVAYFYPESLQPLLMLLLVLFWIDGRWRPAWVAAMMFLMTKEDAAIYLLAFALVRWFSSPAERRPALWLMIVSVVWGAVAFGIAIPLVRHSEGLGGVGIAIDRLGPADANLMRSVVSRLASAHGVAVVMGTLAAVGFLPLLRLRWFLVAMPGLLIDLAVDPATGQSFASAHYIFPILPWLFLAAIDGLQWLERRRPRIALSWLAALVLVTLADTPVLRHLADTRMDPQAHRVLDQVPSLGTSLVSAQANLIPHLPHTNLIRTPS